MNTDCAISIFLYTNAPLGYSPFAPVIPYIEHRNS